MGSSKLGCPTGYVGGRLSGCTWWLTSMAYLLANPSLRSVILYRKNFDISHLCHESLCTNVAHLSAEPRRINNIQRSCRGSGACLGHGNYANCILWRWVVNSLEPSPHGQGIINRAIIVCMHEAISSLWCYCCHIISENLYWSSCHCEIGFQFLLMPPQLEELTEEVIKSEKIQISIWTLIRDSMSTIAQRYLECTLHLLLIIMWENYNLKFGAITFFPRSWTPPQGMGRNRWHELGSQKTFHCPGHACTFPHEQNLSSCGHVVIDLSGRCW